MKFDNNFILLLHPKKLKNKIVHKKIKFNYKNLRFFSKMKVYKKLINLKLTISLIFRMIKKYCT